MKPVAIAARKSTDDRPGLPSIEHQLNVTRSWAEANGYEVVEELVEVDILGATPYEQRPSIVKALDGARRGHFGIVIFSDVDRFARSQREAARIVLAAEDVGLSIFTVEGQGKFDPFGGFEGIIDNVRMAGAQEERKRIKQRMVRGRIQGLRKGRWPGGPVPYGYTLDHEQRLTLEPDDSEVVKRLFQMALDPANTSLIAISKAAERAGLVNRQGLPFSRTHLGELLTDDIYTGAGRTITMGGQNEKGEDLGVPEETHTIPAPVIVDAATFDQVQREIQRRRKVHHRGIVGTVYGLAKRVVHVHPDGTFHTCAGQHPKGRRDERIYRCRSTLEEGCPGMSPEGTPAYRQRTSVNAALVESYVLELAATLLDNPGELRKWADDATRTRLAAEANQPTKEAIAQALDKLARERERALEQNRKGWIDDAETERILADVEAQQADLEAELEDLDQAMDPADIVAQIAQIAVNPDFAPEWWTSGPPQTGTITPSDPEWDALHRGLIDEARGLAPDQEPGELSEWARTWVSFIAETLGIVVVVPPEGYQAAYATTEDPREGRKYRLPSRANGSPETLGVGRLSREPQRADGATDALGEGRKARERREDPD